MVGAVISQTGAHAELAQEYARGLDVWRDEVNAAGGLLGRRVELRVLDDGSEALKRRPALCAPDQGGEGRPAGGAVRLGRHPGRRLGSRARAPRDGERRRAGRGAARARPALPLPERSALRGLRRRRAAGRCRSRPAPHLHRGARRSRRRARRPRRCAPRRRAEAHGEPDRGLSPRHAATTPRRWRGRARRRPKPGSRSATCATPPRW